MLTQIVMLLLLDAVQLGFIAWVIAKVTTWIVLSQLVLLQWVILLDLLIDKIIVMNHLLSLLLQGLLFLNLIALVLI